jgi:hypothetical protein
VRRDPEYKGNEWAPHVPVFRERGEHRDANLLGHIVGDVVVTGDPAKPGPAVPDDHRPQVLNQRLDGIRVPLDGKDGQVPKLNVVRSRRQIQGFPPGPVTDRLVGAFLRRFRMMPGTRPGIATVGSNGMITAMLHASETTICDKLIT